MRFKNKILEYFSDAQDQDDGRNKVLVFQPGMRDMLKQAMKCDSEGDALVLAKAAKMIRRDIIGSKGFHFNGSFPLGCQQASVPTNLNSLISMLLNGADLKDQASADSQAALTISQTIIFNCQKRQSTSVKSRHSITQEPHLPLYIGLNMQKIHAETRSKLLIGYLYKLGLSVSYDRILTLESQLATAVCMDFEEKGVVVPAQLRRGLFTIGALVNIDHNHQLLDSFTTVPAVALKTATICVPETFCNSTSFEGHIAEARLKENKWHSHAMPTRLMEKDNLDQTDAVVWSAYHASTHSSVVDTHVTLTQLLPLFYEKAATAAMMKHGMNMLRQATQFLNPDQTPIIALDAPLYALAKFT